MPKTEPPISVAEAAKILHQDVRTVHRQIEKGTIPYVTKFDGVRGAYVLSRSVIEGIAAERAAAVAS